MDFEDVTGALAKGILAGAIGTAAMTVSSSLEAKLRGREPSTAPAAAAGKVLGVRPASDEGEARFSNFAHWSYGTGWGVVRGLLGLAGLSGAPAAAAHLAALWASEQVMLPALAVAPPLWKWGPAEIGIDAFHHVVYAGATSAAYAALDR